MAFLECTSTGTPKNSAPIEMPKTIASAFVSGDVLAWDRSEHYLVLATSTTENHGADCFFGICKANAATADSVCLASPFEQNQILLADCNADTASNQIGTRRPLTDENTLNNTSTDETDGTAIFEILKLVGATTDKKVLCRICGAVGQVDA